jgi:hypothetical protein
MAIPPGFDVTDADRVPITQGVKPGQLLSNEWAAGGVAM